MKKTVHISIDINDEDKNNCGINCDYKQSLSQFNMSCLLFRENLTWKKHGTIDEFNGAVCGIYARCNKCIRSK